MKTNENGLTLTQWLDAAGHRNSSARTRSAWRKGEDPSDWRAAKPHAKKRRYKAKSRYQSKLQATKVLRVRLPADLRPLFDHMIVLAESAHKQSKEPGRSYLAKRAGLDLLAARRLVAKHGKSE